MKTVFRSINAFWEARTRKSDETIPEGAVRLSTIRFETIELDGSNVDLETEYLILAAMAQQSPEHRRLMLSLRDHLVANFGTGPEGK